MPAATARKPRLTDAKVRSVADAFKQASDQTRVKILVVLLDGEMHVGAMCEMLAMSQPAVSHHIANLRVGALIESDRWPTRAGSSPNWR
jgi:DNA-binding transcriptional ArsR family regulator